MADALSSIFQTTSPGSDIDITELFTDGDTTTTTTTTVAAAGSSGGLVPYLFFSNTVIITGVLVAVLSAFGIAANLIVLRTFCAIGGILKDSVTLTLFTLALSDLGLCVSAFSWTVAAMLYTLEQRLNTHLEEAGSGYYFPVNPQALGIYFVNIMSLFSVTTTLITILLALMRCLAVLLPLKFRRSLSPVTTAAIFVSFLFFAIATRLPKLALMDIRPARDPRTNLTRPTRWYHPDREIVKDVIRSAVDIPLPIAAQIMLVVCVIVMFRALRASRKFHLESGGAVRDETSALPSIPLPSLERSGSTEVSDLSSRSVAPTAGKIAIRNPAAMRTNRRNPTTEKSTASNDRLRPRELRVMKQLIIISLIYMVCNLPKLVRILADGIEPEFTLSGRYKRLYEIASHIQFMAETVNSSVNLFIYLAFNASFRQKCSVCGAHQQNLP